MWSDWFVFCDCGFQSVCPMMEKDKEAYGSFLVGEIEWGKLSLVLMGGAMLSISLIQFSADGWNCAPFLLFTCAKEMLHVHSQRNPSKMVGEANLHSESNLIPARDTHRAQTDLVCTRTQGLHREWDRTVFEHLLWWYGSAVDCHRNRASGCSRLGYGISLLGWGRD